MKHGTGRGLRAGFVRITGKRVDNWFDSFEEAPVVLPIVIDSTGHVSSIGFHKSPTRDSLAMWSDSLLPDYHHLYD